MCNFCNLHVTTYCHCTIVDPILHRGAHLDDESKTRACHAFFVNNQFNPIWTPSNGCLLLQTAIMKQLKVWALEAVIAIGLRNIYIFLLHWVTECKVDNTAQSWVWWPLNHLITKGEIKIPRQFWKRTHLLSLLRNPKINIKGPPFRSKKQQTIYTRKLIRKK